MQTILIRICLTALLGWSVMASVQAAETASALKITHAPASFAIRGQALTLRAKVSGGAGGVENVTLYYALFRDAAPFRVAMASSGMDMYVGTIEAGLLSGLASISYYIEAQDREGSMEETPWYDVQFKNPDAADTPPTRSPVPTPVAPSGSRVSAPASSGDDEGMSGLTIGLIAGGAVAVGAGAYFISDSGGSSDSDDGDGGGGDTNDTDLALSAGTYSGNATICRTIGANPPVCETQSGTIIIDSTGKVFSDTLVDGASLNGTLSRGSFSFSTQVVNAEEGWNGTIIFSGTVVNNEQIVGSISGPIIQGATNGSYSGTFTLNK